MDHGLIEYSAEHAFIFIDWERIRTFAMLEKPLRLPQGKAYRFTKTTRFKERRQTIGQLCASYRTNIRRELSDTEKWFFEKVETMTEAEFVALMNLLPREPVTKNRIT